MINNNVSNFSMPAVKPLQWKKDVKVHPVMEQLTEHTPRNLVAATITGGLIGAALKNAGKGLLNGIMVGIGAVYVAQIARGIMQGKINE